MDRRHRGRGLRVAVDGIGLTAGGGREVARDVILECISHPGISSCVVFLSDAALVEEFRGQSSLRVVTFGERNLVWRSWWWLFGFDSWRRKFQVGRSLHLANVALRRNKAGSAVLVHQYFAVGGVSSQIASRRERLRFILHRLLVWYSCQVSSVVFVQTPVMADLVRRYLRENQRNKVRVALPGVPSSLPRASDSKQGPANSAPDARSRFAYIGHDAPYKNVEIMYRAAAELGPDSEWVFTFDPSTKPTKDWPDNLRFVGFASREDVRDLLCSATALVMPSRAETVGLPLLEAMDLGVPVIAADLPYARFACGDAALYFNPSDPSSLVDACVRVRDCLEIRLRLADAGRRQVAMLKQARGDLVMTNWLAGGA